MQLTLNLDLSTTTRSRDAANRHAKEREKRNAFQKFISASTSISIFISVFASIEISAFYECHSMTVTSQTFVEFREPHYTINDRNEMTLNRQESEIYSISQSTIIQNSMIKARFMFDVAFDVSKIKTHTRSQMKSQQKQLQKDQKV